MCFLLIHPCKMGFNLGACAFRVSSLLYLMRLFSIFAFVFPCLIGEKVWGLLLHHAAEGVGTKVGGWDG
jgi:hypothetical protein